MVNTYAVQSGGCRFESLWGFGFILKSAHYEVDYCGKKNFLSWTAMHIDFVMCKNSTLILLLGALMMSNFPERVLYMCQKISPRNCASFSILLLDQSCRFDARLIISAESSTKDYKIFQPSKRLLAMVKTKMSSRNSS